MENELMPRERLLQFGEQALSDEELLAILLRTGTHDCPVIELAHLLLKQFGRSLVALGHATVTELSSVPGVGTAKALELSAAFALARRLALEDAGFRPTLNTPREIARYMGGVIGKSQQEEFYVLLMDTKIRLQGFRRISLGTLDRSLAHCREVFRPAVREACASVILCHNHPSGDVRPSESDITLTRQLVSAGELLGIRVLDHVIVPSNGGREDGERLFSFAQEGLLAEKTRGAASRKPPVSSS